MDGLFLWMLVLEGFGLVWLFPGDEGDEGLRSRESRLVRMGELWSDIDMGDMGKWRSPPLGEWRS